MLYKRISNSFTIIAENIIQKSNKRFIIKTFIINDLISSVYTI